MTRQTAILVTGMHRSGTSATAGALRLAGVSLGHNLLPPGDDNPKGYFESERAVAINERLLARLGSRWDDVRALPEGWARSDAAREALRDIGLLLDSEFAGAPLWALKDPRLCRLMPVWLEALQHRDINPTALFVVRHPAQVVASIQARNGWAPELGELLWLRYMLEAEASTRGIPRTAIAYDALLKDAGPAIKAATARIGIHLPKLSADPLKSFIDPADRHQRQRRNSSEAGPFAKIVMEVHDALAHVATGEDAWARIEAAHEAFASEWAWMGRHLDAIASMAAVFDSSAIEARETAARITSELNAQTAWARLAVEKEEALLSANAKLNGELTAQIKWSESSVRERERLQAEIAKVRSDLSAQLAWSEQAVKEREDIQAQLAQARSDLAAQVAWAENAVREREEFQAEAARLRTDLAAQLAWSEQAVKEREEIQARFAQARSDLAAQVAWAAGAVREREALQAEAARLRSDLAAQLVWSEQAVQEREEIQARLAQARSELAGQLAWAETAVREREALQAEAARLRSDLTAQVAWSEKAVKEREELQAREATLRSELMAQTRWAEEALADWRLRASGYEQAIADARLLNEAYERKLARMESTISWRATRPLRAMSGMFKKNGKRDTQA